MATTNLILHLEVHPDKTAHELVQEHLASGGTVLVQTFTKATRFEQRHAALLLASPVRTNIRMVAGKRTDTVLPSYVFLEDPRVTITKTMANEYLTRMPDDIPAKCWEPGLVEVTVDERRALLADAKFNGDAAHGPDDMPKNVRQAYQALVKQLEGGR